VVQLMEDVLIRSLLPVRDPRGHKGTFGRVYVLGGSVGYTGAPVFAAEAAARMGSGLVFLDTPADVWQVVAARCRSAMAAPLPEKDADVLGRIGELHPDVALIGPGLGKSKRLRNLALLLTEELDCPLVLDADGINAAAEHIDILPARRGPTVLTPHEGEFIRLGGDLSGGRERGALQLAEKTGAVVVLKGPGTVVASPDGRCRINTTGGCALAKGGSGDVLAGMITSLIGQGAEPFDAASAAVYLHGLCGDLAAEKLTDWCVIPEDLIDTIPVAMRTLLER